MKILKFLLNFHFLKNNPVFFFFMVGMFLMAVLEVVAVASIAPFMSIISNPDILNQNTFMYEVYNFLHFDSIGNFISFLGFSCIALLLASNIFIIVFSWRLNLWCRAQGHLIAEGLLKKYLNQDYEKVIQRNSSDLSKNVLIEADRFVEAILLPYMTFLSRSTVVVFLSILLLSIYKTYFLVAVAFLLFVYVLLSSLLKYQHRVIGKKTADGIQQRYKAASEAVQSIKELKIFKSEDIFLKKFSKPSLTYAFNTALGKSIVIVPKYIIEIIAFSTLIISFVILTQNNYLVVSYLPEISIITLAAYRILPAMQMAYQGKSMADIHFNSLRYLDQEVILESTSESHRSNIQFKRNIQLENLSYKYPGSKKFVLHGVNFSINKGEKIGIVGITGSGKTTLMDILSGLISPSDGSVLIDGKPLNKLDKKGWLEMVSYVSQSPYFYDDTIKNNISMNENNKLNSKKLFSAAKIAQIDDFIGSLPDKYNSYIGDKGINLSGGQRQRIAIARALYKDAEVLFFDEPTSALNEEVETILMEYIYGLNEYTIIIIAHRLSTLKKCDKIIEIKNGSVGFLGDYSSYLKMKNLPNQK